MTFLRDPGPTTAHLATSAPTTITDELSLRYEGWRVAAASRIGVFFSTLAFYTFDTTGSYETVLVAFGFATLGVAALLLALPAVQPHSTQSG